MKKYVNLEIVITVIILLYIGVLAFDGFFVSKLSSKAMAFPNFVFLLAGVVGVLELRRSVIAARAEAAKPPEQKTEKAPIIDNKNKFFEILILTVVYFSLMFLIGFILSSFIFSVIYAIRQKYEKMWQFCAIMLVIICGWYYLFNNMLGVTFPAPLLFNYFS